MILYLNKRDPVQEEDQIEEHDGDGRTTAWPFFVDPQTTNPPTQEHQKAQ